MEAAGEAWGGKNGVGREEREGKGEDVRVKGGMEECKGRGRVSGGRRERKV